VKLFFLEFFIEATEEPRTEEGSQPLHRSKERTCHSRGSLALLKHEPLLLSDEDWSRSDEDYQREKRGDAQGTIRRRCRQRRPQEEVNISFCLSHYTSLLYILVEFLRRNRLIVPIAQFENERCSTTCDRKFIQKLHFYSTGVATTTICTHYEAITVGFVRLLTSSSWPVHLTTQLRRLASLMFGEHLHSLHDLA